MHVLADAHIPLAEELFAGFGEVSAVPASALTPSAVAGADVLLVRSVTRVDADLLAGSPVRFVGTATSGIDHVDTDYLEREGIAFAYAPGSNATSVAEYVVTALLASFADRGMELRGRVAGIVGLGKVGSRVEGRLAALGMEVLCCDPPRALEAADHRSYLSLGELLAACDVITLHVPLTRSGPHATLDLVGAAELGRARPGCWLVNTSRGEVIDEGALRDALVRGRLGGAILDVWNGEPSPDPDLIHAAAIATPHIAGYSYDGRVEGALMLADALAAWLGEPPDAELRSAVAPARLSELSIPGDAASEVVWLDAVARQMYDVRADDAAMRGLPDLPPGERAAAFVRLRAEYPARRSFEWFRAGTPVPERFWRAFLVALGASLADRPQGR